MKILIYLSPDIDLSFNEWWKSHLIWEVKYLHKNFDKIYLICQNSKNTIIKDLKNVKIIKVSYFGKIYFRFFYEFFILPLIILALRIKWAKFLIERSRRLGWISSIIFSLLWWKTIYQLNEPIYYEKFIMFFQNIILFIMNKIRNITYVWSYETMNFNLNKKRFIKIDWWVDLEEFKDCKNNYEEKKYDLIYIWSAQKWSNIELLFKIAKKRHDINFLFIFSKKTNFLEKLFQKYWNLNNITILYNVKKEKIKEYISLAKIWIALYELNSEILKKFDYYYSPIKIHEYKACWLPVIATNIWNIKNLVKNCGILINNKEEKILQTIDKLLNNKDLYEKYSENALKEIKEKYNWGKVVEIYLDILLQY